jgi:uncharacterized protein
VKELIEHLARALVDKPDAVRVDVVEGDGPTILQLHVDPEDVGKVIGKQGRIAKALRTLVRASAAKEDKRATVEILG